MIESILCKYALGFSAEAVGLDWEKWDETADTEGSQELTPLFTGLLCGRRPHQLFSSPLLHDYLKQYCFHFWLGRGKIKICNSKLLWWLIRAVLYGYAVSVLHKDTWLRRPVGAASSLSPTCRTETLAQGWTSLRKGCPLLPPGFPLQSHRGIT